MLFKFYVSFLLVKGPKNRLVSGLRQARVSWSNKMTKEVPRFERFGLFVLLTHSNAKQRVQFVEENALKGEVFLSASQSREKKRVSSGCF